VLSSAKSPTTGSFRRFFKKNDEPGKNIPTGELSGAEKRVIFREKAAAKRGL
jgi:hypothetical protein